MTVVGIEAGFSRDHLVNTDHGSRFDVAGGPGTYAALSAALTLRWLGANVQSSSSSVRVFGAGADEDIAKILASANVDTTWIPGGTAPKLWILTSEAGRRIVSADHSEGHELGGDHVKYAPEPPPPPAFLAGLDALLRCAPREPRIAADRHTLVAVDPDQRQIAAHGWEYLEELAETATLFLPSRVQLTQLHAEPLRAAELIRERTGRAVVARADADGCYVLPVTGGIWHVPAVPTRVIDTTGAGDSHAASLLAAFASYQGRQDLVRCAAIASVVAALTVSDWGPQALLEATPELLGSVDDAVAKFSITEHHTGAHS